MDDKPSNDGVSQGRVQLLLQKLRLCESSASVREDICVLERVLQDLIYWHHSRKISPKWSPGTSEHTSEASKTVPSTVRKVKVSIEEVLKLNFKLQDQLKQLQTALLPRIKSTEKLVFVGQRLEEIRGLVVKADETGGRLVVVGPRDIKVRSEGRVHIGDQILAVGQHVLNPSTVGCDSHFLKSDKNSTLPSAPIFDEDSSANLNSCTVVDQKISLRSNSNDDIQLPWKSDNEGGEAITWPSALIDRYEKLIEKAATAVYKEESENCAQIVVVTLLRQSPHMVLTGDWTEVQIIHLPNNPSVGLGFGIVGGTSTGVVVKTILPGSVADKDGRLRPGDHILMICGISVHGMSSQQVATILRQQDTLVELVVGRPALFFDSSKDTPGCWIMPTRAALCPKSLEEQVEKHTDTIVAPLESATGVENHPGPLQFVATVKSAALCRVHNGVEELHTESVNGSAELGDTQEGDLKRASQEESASEVPSQLVPSLKSNTDPPNTDSSCSFRKLQEMALTTFARANWIPGKYKVIEVELCRDPVLGLGITVAGYVHKNEEIGGVFVKSLVPNTSAFYSKKIQLHDLIHEVNGQSLVGLNHSDSVRTLVRSGVRAKLKLIRFLPGSPQAECLKMLQEQEAATQINDAQNTLPDVVADWKRRLGSDFEVVSVDLIPDKCDDGGLGISLEGTVDVVNGTQLCPHHYIDSLRPGGPAASSNALRSGDELLQANEMVLYGESHITVRQALSKAVSTSQRVRLTVARKAQFINVFMPRPEQSLPIAYPLLAASDDRLVKAKSETCITSSDTTAAMLEQVSRRLRSRSLHLLTGLAIWKCVPIIVQLEKDSRGLGFSVVDYRDSLHPGESVIVVRSLVPGGLAQADGRIVPGDKLMFVNDEDLSNSTLEHAVAVLKSAPDGLVRLGIAKPVPIEQCGGEIEGHSPIISRSERVLAEGSSPRPYRRRQKQVSSFTSSQETVWLGALEYRRQHPQGYYPSSGSLTPSTPRTYNTSLNGSNLSMTSWSPCSTRSITPCGSPFLHGSWASDVVYLPASLERSIKIQKGALSLGLVLDAEVDRGINGCQVRSICSKKALGRDGRVQVSDFIVKINTENLRNVTNSQARAILKRTNLIGTHCSITYITASDAKLWRERYHQDADYQLPVVNRLSPKIFPKFYRSPYFEGKQMGNAEQRSLLENNLPDSEYSGANGTPPPLVAMHSAAPVIGGKLVEEFSYNFVQTVLKDVWLDLLVSDCWTALSTKEREPSLSERIEIAPSTSAAASKESIHQESSEIWSVDAGFRKDWDSVRNFEKADSGVDRRWGSMSSWSQESLRAEGCGSPKEFIVAETLSPESDVTCTNEVRRQSLIDAGWINPSVSTTAIESFPSSPSSATDVAGSRTKFWSEARTVVLHRKPNQSFGISIVGGRVEVSQKGGQPGMRSTVSGIFIKSVLPNSPAGLSGMMNMGDRVISVNDQDLREATHEQAVQVIKNARNPVKFVVQSLHSFTSYQAAFDTIKSGIEEQDGEMVNISDKIGEIGSEGVKRGSTVLIAENLPVVPVITTETNSIAEVVNDSDAQFRKPIFESYRRESADEEKKLKEKGAGEIEPSEISAKEDEIIKRSPVIQNKEKLISSTVRDLSWKSNVISTGCKYMSDPRLRGVDPDSAAALSKCEDDLEEEDNFFYTKDKIARKYGSLPGNTILLKLDKVPRSGLGLSLAGNRDPAKMNVFVVAVRSTCPLPIKIGDELLEVNGKVLIGLTHLDASAKIRECCEDGILELLLLRRFEALAITSNAETDENKSATKDLQMNISEATALHSVENVRKKSSQNESTVEIETGRETFIEIDKDGKGLGLSIVGGSDTVLGTVVIHEVYSDGAAAVDGRLKPGDQVLEVNGVSLRGVSHEQAILLLRRTPSKVRLLVYRDINLQLSLLDPTQIYNIFEMELTKKPGRGLGLSIVGRKNEPGVYVSEVVKGGAAEADGRLMQGDQILAVNGQDVTSSMQEDVAAKLKACPGRVALKVGRWKLTEAANKAHAATEASLSMSGEQYTDGAPQATKFLPVAENKFQTPDNPVIVKPNDGEAALSSTNLLLSTPAPTSKAVVPQVSEGEENQPPKILHPDLSQPVTEEPGSGANPKSLVKEEETSTCRTPQTKNVDLIKDLREEDSDSLLVMLRKIPDQQLGMGIGKRTRGILVTSLQPGSVAAEKLKVGDRLMAVNGVPITDQLSAVTLVKASGEKLWLQIARPKNFCNP